MKSLLLHSSEYYCINSKLLAAEKLQMAKPALKKVVSYNY